MLWRTKPGNNERENDSLHAVMCTPIVTEEHVYGVGSYGDLRCLDADTGRIVWETRKPTGDGRWWNAFLVPHGDRVVICNEQGEIIFAKLSPAGYEELSRAKLIEPTQPIQRRMTVWSHPAFAMQSVFARNDGELIRVNLATSKSGRGGWGNTPDARLGALPQPPRVTATSCLGLIGLETYNSISHRHAYFLNRTRAGSPCRIPPQKRSRARFRSASCGRMRPARRARWERHRLTYEPNLNVISVLQKIAAQARTDDGRKTTPVAWDCNCLEEVCGACTMLVNGRTRQACSALVDRLLDEQPGEIELRPMCKFPVLRDLVVDRSRMFRALEKVKAWIPVDDYSNRGPGPKESPESQQRRYPLSECMTCGCCLEACPQYTKIEVERLPGESDADFAARRNAAYDTGFVGAAAISQVMLFNDHGTGKDERRRAARSADGARRHPRLRQRSELRGRLPEEHPAHDVDRPRRPGHDGSLDQELVRSLANLGCMTAAGFFVSLPRWPRVILAFHPRVGDTDARHLSDRDPRNPFWRVVLMRSSLRGWTIRNGLSFVHMSIFVAALAG